MSEILSHIDIFHQVGFIFIFCSNIDEYKYIFHEQLNIIGIYTKFNLLCSSITEQLNLIDKEHDRWIIYDQENALCTDLSQQTNNFLWLQLFHQTICHFPFHIPTTKQKIKSLRLACRENSDEIKFTYQFVRKYRPVDALQWYFNSSFLQKVINKAIQTKDIRHLCQLEYFLRDLIQSLRYEHKKIVQSGIENFIFHHTMKLTHREFNQLYENQGKLVAFKGFLLVNSSIHVVKETDLIDVLFEIECNVKEVNDNVTFVSITQLNQGSCQNAVLFDLNTTFKLEYIQQTEQIWLIKLTVVNDGPILIEKYLDDTYRQNKHLNIPIVFGKFISNMNQWDQAYVYLQHLFNYSSGEDLLWIEYLIGETFHYKGELHEARIYYDRAYDRMNSSSTKDSSVILSDIGNLLYLQGKYEDAYDYHQRALRIRQKF
ncbi:hypothetical protein I4U23_031392 [Adineta vaga]|nr:hypothetical protein I4U23_031392 [Adineta vaga]